MSNHCACFFAATCCGVVFLSGVQVALAQSTSVVDSTHAEDTGFYDRYTALKEQTTKDTGLSWAMDLSYMQQWGRRDGGSPAGQWLATPSVTWKVFDSPAIGSGSVQLVYTAVRYGTNQTGEDIQNNLGLITGINDNTIRQNVFNQLTYTHSFPGDKVKVGGGQYPFSNFDTNQYLGNQQRNFNNLVLSQDGSDTYPTTGIGAFVQVNATSTIQFATGFQGVNNHTGETLTTKNIGDRGYAWFGYAQWTPAFEGLGAAQYSITYYDVPNAQEQLPDSHGWSVNAVQNLNDTWAIFGRVNRAYNFVTPIRASYAIGAAMNNPLGRSTSDQIGLAFGYSDAAPQPTNSPGARNEKIIETYWNWTFAKGLLLTPSLQYIRDPALAPERDSAWALSLRSTLMF